jgi:hypothetical protein
MRPDARTLVALLLLAGCNSLPAPREPAPDPVAVNEAIQVAQLNSHIAALGRVVGGTATEQAEEIVAARLAYENSRQGPAALRYGLLLAAPAHPARDPQQARQVLTEALARPELLSTIERALAMVELERINAELRLSTENERLVADARAERERQRNAPSSAALTRQLQAEREENARLKKALDEARAKLDAIAEFESRQATRPPASEGRSQ